MEVHERQYTLNITETILDANSGKTTNVVAVYNFGELIRCVSVGRLKYHISKVQQQSSKGGLNYNGSTYW